MEPPDKRNVTAGVQLLEELGALAPTGSTARAARLGSPGSGRRLARLPIDPRLGRMILEAERLGCLREVLVIAAALSLQDPRERPAELQAQADQQHARFKAEGSRLPDLAQPLALPQGAAARAVSSSAFRRMCKREFLNYLRVREWQDFESQLRQVCKEMRTSARGRHRRRGAPYDADGIHQALLSGLLSHIGLLEERDEAEKGGSGGARCGSTSAPAAPGSRSSPAAAWPARTRSS